MSETKHTPGPWEARRHINGSHWFVDAPSSDEDGTGITVSDELGKGDARLIAAAPGGGEP